MWLVAGLFVVYFLIAPLTELVDLTFRTRWPALDATDHGCRAAPRRGGTASVGVRGDAVVE